MGEVSPTPNQRMAIGIHAIGEMGRRICTSGFSMRYVPCIQPIHSPSGMATHTASPKPMPTLIRDALMCCQSVPLSISSQVPLTTAHGVGKIRLCAAMTAPHQAAINTTITARAGSDSLRRCMVYGFVCFTNDNGTGGGPSGDGYA